MKKIIFSVTLLIISFGFLLPSVSAANLSDAFEEPLEDVGSDIGYREDVDPGSLVGRVIRIALSFLGVVFFILMLYGGFLWMTAAGSDEQVGKAKKLIIAAVTGLIIVLASYAISYFILSELGEELLESSPPVDGGEGDPETYYI